MIADARWRECIQCLKYRRTSDASPCGYQLIVQKGEGVIWLLGSFSWFLTGTIFPVGALPAPLQQLAALIPFTHSLDGLRLALLRGASFSELAGPIGALALFAVVLLPISLGIFSLALRHARLQGTLSFY